MKRPCLLAVYCLGNIPLSLWFIVYLNSLRQEGSRRSRIKIQQHVVECCLSQYWSYSCSTISLLIISSHVFILSPLSHHFVVTVSLTRWLCFLYGLHAFFLLPFRSSSCLCHIKDPTKLKHEFSYNNNKLSWKSRSEKNTSGC